MPPTSNSDAPVTVRVICEETIVSGGSRTTQWQVKDGATWIAAHRHASCVAERGASAPGTVWRETLTLKLVPGSEIKQVINEPMPAKPRSAFDYLRREVRGTPRKVRENHYTISESGGLLRSKA